MDPVGLVGGGDDHAGNPEVATGLQHRPGAADVRLERRQWRGVGDPDDRLGSEMKNGVDLVLAEGPLDQPGVTDVSVHDVHVTLGALDDERRSDDRVALEHGRACSLREQGLDQPAPE